MVVIFAAFNFLFYRIMSSALFDDPMTLWACAISAILTTAISAYASITGLLWAGSEDETGNFSVSLPKYLVVALVAAASASLAAYLITLGFSKNLYDDISRWSYRDEFYETDWFWFVVMISIPVVSYMALFYRNLKGSE